MCVKYCLRQPASCERLVEMPRATFGSTGKKAKRGTVMTKKPARKRNQHDPQGETDIRTPR